MYWLFLPKKTLRLMRYLIDRPSYIDALCGVRIRIVVGRHSSFHKCVSVIPVCSFERVHLLM